MNTIIVPVVDSPAGREALALAKDNAASTGATLVLVATATVSDRVVQHVEAVRARIAQLEADLVGQGFNCVTEWAVGESLGALTVRAAEQHGADLIVMSLRRRTPVGKALLGSYEQEVLLSSPCPVLSIPERHSGGSSS